MVLLIGDDTGHSTVLMAVSSQDVPVAYRPTVPASRGAGRTHRSIAQNRTIGAQIRAADTVVATQGVAGPACQDQTFDNAIAAGGASNWTKRSAADRR
jgi:hypothetical protein